MRHRQFSGELSASAITVPASGTTTERDGVLKSFMICIKKGYFCDVDTESSRTL